MFSGSYSGEVVVWFLRGDEGSQKGKRVKSLQKKIWKGRGICSKPYQIIYHFLFVIVSRTFSRIYLGLYNLEFLDVT